MRQPTDPALPSHPLYDHRLAKESKALREALRRFISAQGAIPDESCDGYIDRAFISMSGRSRAWSS